MEQWYTNYEGAAEVGGVRGLMKELKGITMRRKAGCCAAGRGASTPRNAAQLSLHSIIINKLGLIFSSLYFPRQL
jgi:hypothetical protein